MLRRHGTPRTRSREGRRRELSNSAQQKFDGHRALLFTPPAAGGGVLIQTRRGSLVQNRFPDLVAAALDQLPPGLVLDGELLVWDPEVGSRTSNSHCEALLQQDHLPEQEEAGSAVELSLDFLDAVHGSLDAARAPVQGEAGDHGVEVSPQAQ
ncbi:hypothetical protein ACFYNM_30290 [Streptomyces spororaveus]|uniref:ATP-dependent DNA ligase n=1 Tax=Streptomyces spororaveus TaxID=284039 RepID=UPI00367578D6